MANRNQTAYFANPDGRVYMRHNKPDLLSQEELNQAALIVDKDKVSDKPQGTEDYRYAIYIENGEVVFKKEARSNQ